uniref:Pyrophosphate--fructose 6-phosphate 1-phosphotransferase n=2 Tax=Calcidiscus leptoporus TaxID=127549 RepID=A0A7S0J078_9EUKA|mmetsp:Transcript_31018/g.72079  ORF Transcript_31018/g.72079 Transcript_31018/m.72079 type:complete len:423 (+) Transcript_31018:58-1326(+)
MLAPTPIHRSDTMAVDPTDEHYCAPKRVGILTAGGLAPCLSSAVGALITEYAIKHPTTEIICYLNGYKGLLLGDSITVTPAIRAQAAALHYFGGSPIGNSRVKLTNVKDCVKRGLVKEGENPQQVAADQLIKDGVEVLHTVGGDDTNIAAADLSKFLLGHDYHLCVIGMPKTIDNDVFPIKQSLGAWTAAEQGAIFFENVVNESTANPRMMIVHEVMGRDCGYLTAATAQKYRQRLDQRLLLPQLGVTKSRYDVHAVYLPELPIDIDAEAKRLKAILDEQDNVNIFISEGAGVKDIVAKMEAEGKEIQRDAFGHVKLDTIQPGKYFADVFSGLIGAEKVMVQKSGYFARSAAANHDDILLIRQSAQYAVDSACKRGNGVVGLDEDAGDVLRLCEFDRIKGGKAFDIKQPWFNQMLADIGQVG